MTSARRGPLKTVDRLRKLRAMTPGELWTRVRYDGYCRLERGRHARGALTDPTRLRAALVPALARSANWKTALVDARRHRTARYYVGVEDLASTRTLFGSRFEEEGRKARAEAQRVLQGEFAFFGHTFAYGAQIDWHADPVTRAQWPQVYHRDVPVHGGDIGYGDVKHVWELGRHQFLIDLAKGWAVEQDPAFAAGCRNLVFDWRAKNPVGTGVAWSCALEPAFRALSWLWAYFLTLEDDAFDEASHIQWLEGFHDHGWFLYRHLEYYTSPYNHLVGEACALYSLGVLFPEFRESAKWRAHGRHLLESRLSSQFYTDGGSVEQSAFYHHATTGFYLLAALLGRANGEEFSGDVWAAIQRGLEFSMWMQQPDGSTPRIGGADDGKPIRIEQLPLWDFRPYLAAGAVVFDRGDFKAAAGRFYEDALWLLGADAVGRFDGLQPETPSVPSHALESSGYVVMRDGWQADGNYLCFDCGEQAAGLRRDDIPSAAHGHADCLSIIVWRGGRPVLVDAGFYCYNGPKPWQDHFRETAAHNTVRIDGRDQAVHINKMAWSHTFEATLEGYGFEADGGWAVASHDGYRSLEPGGVIHRRAVSVRERGYIVVADTLVGAGEHDVEVTFQFAPGALRLQGTRATFDERVVLDWAASPGLTARVQEGGAEPDGGWIASSLGVKVAAPRLVLSGRLTLPAVLVSLIADATPEPLAVSQQSGAIAVAGAGWTERLSIESPVTGGAVQRP